jgi:hypothetical protein
MSTHNLFRLSSLDHLRQSYNPGFRSHRQLYARSSLPPAQAPPRSNMTLRCPVYSPPVLISVEGFLHTCNSLARILNHAFLLTDKPVRTTSKRPLSPGLCTSPSRSFTQQEPITIGRSWLVAPAQNEIGPPKTTSRPAGLTMQWARRRTGQPRERTLESTTAATAAKIDANHGRSQTTY